MHAQPNTVGHPNTGDKVTFEVTLTISMSKDFFIDGAPFEEFGPALADDLLSILDEDIATPLRTVTDVEISARSRLL
jgi:hypothetical protein